MQILELAAKLQSIGLSDKQAKVYVAALFLGPNSAQKISQQADVNRATTYVILDELMEMGLVSQSSAGKKTVFVAEGADAIDRHIESVKKDLQLKQDELHKLKPELDQIEHDNDSGTPQVFFFKGKEGIEQSTRYYRKHAKANSTVYVLTNNDETDRIQPEQNNESPQFRKRKNITAKVLYSGNDDTIKTSAKIKRFSKKLSVEVRADVEIQEDFAIFHNYRDGKYVAMVIENPDIAAGLRQLFELAYDNYQEKK
jgi:sugar-specific transcriptional regulator TrmB